MAAALPDPRLHCPEPGWYWLCAALAARTEGRHESGAFLLGAIEEQKRIVSRAVFYDQLDPRAYATGVCVLRAPAFAALWKLCASEQLQVVADVHVHPRGAWQSPSDQANPMIAQAGHVAIILPDMARPPIPRHAVGFYQYLGAHRWRSFGGRDIGRHLILGDT